MLYRLSAAAALLAGIAFLSPFPLPETATKTISEGYHQQKPEFPADPARFAPPTASPIAGLDMAKDVSSGFGMRKHPYYKSRKLHRGIDLKAKSGTPVLATADGRVIFAGNDGNYGIVVRILHSDGYVTAYCVGSTGLSTAPHLHYEVLKDDVPVDPLALR